MVEKWLLQVEHMMILSLRYVIKNACLDFLTKNRNQWVLDWPGQIVICGSQVYWTQDCEINIQNNTLRVTCNKTEFLILEKNLYNNYF